MPFYSGFTQFYAPYAIFYFLPRYIKDKFLYYEKPDSINQPFSTGY